MSILPTDMLVVFCIGVGIGILVSNGAENIWRSLKKKCKGKVT